MNKKKKVKSEEMLLHIAQYNSVRVHGNPSIYPSIQMLHGKQRADQRS